MIQHRQILGNPQRMPVSDNVGRLADAQTLGARGDVAAHQHRVGTDLETLVTKVVLGEPDRDRATVVRNPQTMPSQVLFGLTRGNNFVRPHRRQFQIAGQLPRFLHHLVKGFLKPAAVLIAEISESHVGLLELHARGDKRQGAEQSIAESED